MLVVPRGTAQRVRSLRRHWCYWTLRANTNVLRWFSKYKACF